MIQFLISKGSDPSVINYVNWFYYPTRKDGLRRVLLNLLEIKKPYRYYLL